MSSPEPTRVFRFSVTLLIHTKSGLVWWPAEYPVPRHLDEVGAMDYLNQIIVEDGTIRCTKLVTASNEGQGRFIRGREPVLIGTNAIATITPLHIDLIEGQQDDRAR